jgi:starch synthase (maltosyl-transferring)
LGTLEDFREFVAACQLLDIEVALDFAVQCSPDHPWLKQHPQWFKRRPDGSMRYAENPPKKYEDIVNPDFSSEDAGALWNALREVVLFWIDQGVKIFRVDNPHTKPFRFWEWLIREVQLQHPDVIFLAEAFTRPKLMKGLAKLGFTQSYTYFTWRTQKWEFEQYLSELTGYPERDFYRPNFFVNTPDILPYHLQGGETWMFKSRVALAATLSSSYGIYNGFELLEHESLPGREEYLDSEKYQWKERDWDAPGNIKDWTTRLNRIRKENRALQLYDNLRFYRTENDAILCYGKMTPARDNIILIVVNLDPHRSQHSYVHIPMEDFGAVEADVYQVHDLLNDARYLWRGNRNYVELDPQVQPAHIFRVRHWLAGEKFV